MCQQATHRADRSRLIRLVCALEIMVATLVTAYRALCKLTNVLRKENGPKLTPYNDGVLRKQTIVIPSAVRVQRLLLINNQCEIYHGFN